MANIKIVNADTTPICPHCNKELTTIKRAVMGLIEQTIVFLCPHCEKVIGISGQL